MDEISYWQKKKRRRRPEYISNEDEEPWESKADLSVTTESTDLLSILKIVFLVLSFVNLTPPGQISDP
jgi:hypothetical protein